MKSKNTNQKNSDEKTSNRKYKDTLFKFIFGREENKKWLLSLYNALAGTNCTDETEIEINTIETVLFITRKNDVSFLIGSEMYLFEHQSTFSPNMPLRGLLYFASLYNKYIKSHRNQQNLYGNQVFKIPAPRFYVMYNGKNPYPDKMYLKLSDAFETPTEGFEWTATMLNINLGHNEALFSACKSLQDYAMYVNMVRENETIKKMTREAAIDAALDEAIRLNLLEGFFGVHRAEVRMFSILEEEFDIKGYGEEIRHENAIDIARSLLSMGLTLEQIAQATSLPLSEVTALQSETTT